MPESGNRSASQGWRCVRNAALCAALILMAAGCATQRVAQPAAGPAGHGRHAGAREAATAKPHPLTADLVRKVEESLRAAGAADAKGDADGAAQSRRHAIEVLEHADISPASYAAMYPEHKAMLAKAVVEAGLEPLEGEGAPEASNDKDIRIPDPLNERVKVELEAIQKAYPHPFQRGLDRSGKYLPHIYAELEKANLPRELAWVVMVESQFTPKIVSSAGAGGMWQFMKATGARYNLRIDNYVDERYNWRTSTRAALAYFKSLRDYFDGSWPLAITAYNMGEYGLDRAVAANGGMHNLWELIETPPASDRIRLETKTYYAKFLASLMVANNPEKYGFKPSSQAPDDSVPVPVSGMYALDELDRAMGFSTGTLAQLNPDLVREVTPPSGEYAVTIPAGAEAKFREALDKTPKLKYGVRQHRVRKGDTTASIAAKYNLSEEELMKTNGLKAGKKLKVGLVVKVPGFYHEEEMAKGGPGPAQQNGTMYTVKAGDSLSGIAQSSGVSVQDLQKWNNLGLRSVIQPGDKLFVSDPGSWAEDAVDIPLAADVAENASRQTYAVKPGDFLAKIATQKNVAVEDLIKWNKLPKDGTIQPGAKLYVSAPGTVAPAKEAKPAPAAAPKQIEHTVGKGDTLAGIAGKYGIDLKPLLAANKLKETAAIQPGQKLVVPAPTKNLPAPEKTAKAAPQDKSQPKETPQAASPDKTTYTVAKGDTAGSIADKHKVSLADLTKWNKLDKNGTVVLGQKLALSDPNAAPKREEAKEPAPEEKPEPEKVASDAPPAMEKISYKVAKGDTAGSIADKHKVSLADLTKWNKLDKNGTVVLDQALVLYVPAKEAPKAAPASAGKDMKLAAKEGASKAKPEQAPKAAKAERPEAKPEQPPKAAKAEQPKAKPEQAPKTAKAEQPKAKPEKTAKAKSPDKVKHTVDKGQSIEGIAGKYGVKAADLYAWNGWQKNHVLQPGESVTILK